MSKPNGVVLYLGPSKFNGKMIVAIATGLTNKSENIKTGKMIQTWILCLGENPVKANFNFNDDSICGDCKHRFGTCYVTLHQAPYAVYNGFLRGIYPIYNEVEHAELFKGKNIRLGSYGDPCATPYSVWENILKLTDKHTGYTHAWHNKKIDLRFKDIIMASCDTVKEYKKAISLGWRTFRIRLSKDAPILENEFACPAENHDTSCSNCLSCRGLSCQSSKNPVIVFHGAPNKAPMYRDLIQRINNKKKFKVDVKGFKKAVCELRKSFMKV